MLEENKENNFVSAVIYIRNNQDNITNFLNTINDFLSQNFKTYEIICVNDASKDESVKKIKEFANENNSITIINMSHYQGMEKSMQAGIDLAIGDYIFEFDSSEISFKTELLKEVYNNCIEGSDIVCASPKASGHKQAGCFYYLYNKVSNNPYKLRTEAFRILSRRAVNRVCSMSNSPIYRKSAYVNCGLKTETIFYDALKSIPHTTREERSMQYETAINALILYTDIAYKFSMSFAVIMVALTIFAGIYAGYIYLIGNSIKGWTTIMLLLSFGFFAIISILTILIKYTSLILKIVFHKQKYIIKSIEKLG